MCTDLCHQNITRFYALGSSAGYTSPVTDCTRRTDGNRLRRSFVRDASSRGSLASLASTSSSVDGGWGAAWLWLCLTVGLMLACGQLLTHLVHAPQHVHRASTTTAAGSHALGQLRRAAFGTFGGGSLLAAGLVRASYVPVLFV